MEDATAKNLKVGDIIIKRGIFGKKYFIIVKKVIGGVKLVQVTKSGLEKLKNLKAKSWEKYSFLKMTLDLK